MGKGRIIMSGRTTPDDDDRIGEYQAAADATAQQFNARVDEHSSSDSQQATQGQQEEYTSPAYPMLSYSKDQMPLAGNDLRDYCYATFQQGEGNIDMAYFDTSGHLTVGVGSLIAYNGGRAFNYTNQVFNVCGYTQEQQTALLKATQLIQPADVVEQRSGRFMVTKREGNDRYQIVLERIPGAGSKVISVQKNNERVVTMPRISEDKRHQVFNMEWPMFYNRAQEQIPGLSNQPRILQGLSIHQVYGRWSFPEARNSASLTDSLTAVESSINYRMENKWGVSAGERAQLAEAQQVVSDTLRMDRVLNRPVPIPAVQVDATFDGPAIDAQQLRLILNNKSKNR